MKLPVKSALLAATFLSVGFTAQAQSFNRLYGFGDSLTDCCGNGPYINRPNGGAPAPGYLDLVAPQISASYTRSLQTNLAIGGAQSGNRNVVPALDTAFGQLTGFLPQVSRFNQPVTSRDIAAIWIGTNDIWPSALANPGSNFAPLGVQPPVSTLTNYVAGNVRAGVDQLVAQGVRNIILITPYDLAISSTSGDNKVLASAYSVAIRDAYANLYTPGVNTYFLDNLTLMNRVQANPAAYGFAHATAADNCSANPSCATGPASVQDTYVFNDVIHLTSAFNTLMSKYIVNTINARTSLPAQGDLGQAVGQAFSGILLNRLDAYRDFNTPAFVAGTYTADLPGRPVAPSTIPIMVGSPLSLFVEGAYAGIDRNARATPTGPGTPGLGADFAGVTAGIEYRVTPNLLIGAAFNYFNTSVDLRGPSNARIDLDSYQGGVFASYNDRNFFADGAVTYGASSYGLSRPGVFDTLTASPDGNTLTAAGKVGYLFDLGSVRVGPIAELTYANVHLGSYRERGDSLLTLGVQKQDFDGLTGGAGVQVRTALPLFGGRVGAYVNLTAQHDFLDGVRTITSFSTNAPALLINTGAGRRGEDVYGKVAGGFTVDLGNGLNGVVSGSTTFGRSYGDDHTVSAGLRYRF